MLGEGLIPVSESSSGASIATCSRCPWLGRGVEPGDLQSSLPTSSISLILSSCAAEQGVVARADMSPLPGCSPCPLVCQALPHRWRSPVTIAHAVSLLPPQSVCAIFEKSVKTLLDDFAPMVPQLCEMLGQMYSTIPQASAIDLTRQVGTTRTWPGLRVQGKLKGCRTASVLLHCLLQLVHIFAHEPAHFPPIKALFLLVTSVTLTLFQQGMCD